MEKGMTRFSVGLGGWEHEAFDHCFYPRPEMPSGERLAFYAGFFDAVEVRPTFWDETLTAADARAWMDAVGRTASFRFTLKLHSSFTHKKTIRPHLTRNFRGMAQELARGNRLGALLAQFPYAFTNTSSNRFHLEKIGEIFRGFPVHVEFRHESWHTPELLSLLAEYGLRLVSSDLPRVKQFMPFTTGVVGTDAYLRLHGRNERGWLLGGFDARYDYLYNGREMHEISRRLQSLAQRCGQVTVIFNNTTGGKAIANAFQLSAILANGRSSIIPPETLAAFPHLQSIARPIEGTLFSAEDYRAAM